MSNEQDKNSKSPMSKLKFSALYWFYSIIITIIAVPILSKLSSSGVTAREGAKGYAYVYGVAAYSIILIMLAFIIYLIWILKRHVPEKN